MKKFILITLLVIFCFTAITGSAYEPKKGIYLGLKSGIFALNSVNALNIFSLGGLVGCPLPFKNKYFEAALEGEFNLGYLGGGYISGYPGNRSHIRTMGEYGVVKTIPVNEIYTKGKIGITHETVIRKISGVETSSEDMGLSLGIGVGYRAANNVNLELEFATTHSDMKFFNVNINFMF